MVARQVCAVARGKSDGRSRQQAHPTGGQNYVCSQVQSIGGHDRLAMIGPDSDTRRTSRRHGDRTRGVDNFGTTVPHAPLVHPTVPSRRQSDGAFATR